MIYSCFQVYDMSSITSGFPLRADESLMHYTQQDKRRIKLRLYFYIPGEQPSPEGVPRFAQVRVPKGVPVARLRHLIIHCEGELQNIFGKCWRANFVMITEEFSDDWHYEHDLPMAGVVYV